MLRDVIRRTAIAGAALVVMAGAVARAPAQVTTEGGASILVFPKVVADSSTDTVIQLANRSDHTTVDVFCSYVNGAAALWQSTGFSIALGPSRPTHWSAAGGRMPDAGTDSIDVPAAPAPFRGELLCVEVDVSGAPLSGDDLAGQATVVDLPTGNVGAYPADGLQAVGFNDGDNNLCIGGMGSDTCPVGAEYGGCPAEWILTVPADGSADAQLGSSSQLSTRLAVAPCSQDLRDATPGSVDIQVTVFNELAQQFTGDATVACWADLSFADIAGQIFTRGTLGTDYAEARLRPAAGSGGFMVVAQTTRSTGGASPIASAAAVSLHHRGSADASDLIMLPESRSP